MKIEIIKTTSGPACGKQMMRVTSDEGKLLGWIQPVNLSFEATLGGTQTFLSKQCFGHYELKACSCLLDAFLHLNISLEELDATPLPAGCYDEYWNKPY